MTRVPDRSNLTDMIHSPWPAIGLVLGVLVALLCLLGIVQRKYSLHPEFIRKLLHVAMGLLTLTLPWMFAKPWPVFLLAGISISLFALLRVYPSLGRWFADVIHTVKRDSLGDLYFPLGVSMLFFLADGDVLLYSIPLLTLALADPAAAVVGMRYGRSRYHGVKSMKSVEGSLAFFVAAFILTFVTLQALTETASLDAALIALDLSALLALVEALGSHGLDNLLIPVAAFFLLKHLLSFDVAILLTLLVCTTGLIVVLYSWRAPHEHFPS